jgi:hypothetical protein
VSPFIGQKDENVLCDLLLFKDTKTGKELEVWFFKKEQVFRIVRMSIIKFLSAYSIRALETSQVSTAVKMEFTN